MSSSKYDFTIPLRQRKERLAEWMPDKSNKVNLVAAAVTGEIIQKKLEVGTQLLSTRQLAKALGVSYLTAREGMAQLAKEGIVDFRHGSGTYLARSICPTTIAVIHDAVYKIQETYLYNLLPAFQKVISSQGLKMETIATHKGNKGRQQHAELINRWHRGELKGLLIVSRYPARQILDFIASGIPFVWVDNTLGKEPICSVRIDAETAFFSSFPLFKNKEESSIPIHVLGARTNTRTKWERTFYQISEMGFWPQEQMQVHFFRNPEEVKMKIQNLFEKTEFPCGIYLFGDSALPIVFDEIKRRQLSVPCDVRLVVAYLSTSQALYPMPVTGWKWPFEQVAEQALKLLDQIANHRLEEPLVEYISPVLHEGCTAYKKSKSPKL